MHANKPLELAQVLKPQGLKGELKLKPFTNSLSDLSDISYVYIRLGGDFLRREVVSLRFYKQFAYMKISGCDDIDAAETLRGAILYADRKALPDGRHYLADLIDMSVAYASGEAIGQVSDIVNNGGVDVYTVSTNDGELMFPAAPGVITDVDYDAGKILVEKKSLEEVSVYA